MIVGKLSAVVKLILKALARVLGLEECYFLDQMGQESQAFDQNVEGLQNFKDDIGWVKVPVLPDALVVYMGDQMEIMSNGQYKSPIHRVVISSQEDFHRNVLRR